MVDSRKCDSNAHPLAYSYVSFLPTRSGGGLLMIAPIAVDGWLALLYDRLGAAATRESPSAISHVTASSQCSSTCSSSCPTIGRWSSARPTAARSLWYSATVPGDS